MLEKVSEIEVWPVIQTTTFYKPFLQGFSQAIYLAITNLTSNSFDLKMRHMA